MLILDEQHRYFLDGARIPGVTEVCKILAPRSFPIEEYYLRRGQIIHRICEWSDQGVLEPSSVDTSLDGYLGAWQGFCNHTGFKRDHVEKYFVHPKYLYGMRIDGHGILFDYPSVVDIKTGQPRESDLLQCPAYLFGLRANGILTERAFDVYLKANGTWRLKEVKSPTEKFLRFLGGIKQWREENDENNSGQR